MNEIQTNRAKREIVFVNFTGKRKIKEMIMIEKKRKRKHRQNWKANSIVNVWQITNSLATHRETGGWREGGGGGFKRKRKDWVVEVEREVEKKGGAKGECDG